MSLWSIIREKKDEIVAKKIALSLEQDERKKKRDLQERMRLQLRLDDEAAQVEAQMEIQRYLQEEKDKVSNESINYKHLVKKNNC